MMQMAARRGRYVVRTVVWAGGGQYTGCTVSMAGLRVCVCVRDAVGECMAIGRGGTIAGRR